MANIPPAPEITGIDIEKAKYGVMNINVDFYDGRRRYTVPLPYPDWNNLMECLKLGYNYSYYREDHSLEIDMKFERIIVSIRHFTTYGNHMRASISLNHLELYQRIKDIVEI